MKTNIFVTISLFLMSTFSAMSSEIKQNIPNAETTTLSVSGNCGMCKKNIETAANQKGKTKGSWDADTRVLTVIYNSKKTNPEEILKRVAYAGYDNEKFLAPEAAYSKLHGCCQYERTGKTEKATATNKHEGHAKANDHSGTIQKDKASLESVYAHYFAVKDALVKSDAGIASTKAKELLKEINAVKMESLGTDEHKVYMKYLADLKTDAGHIAESKDVSHQREHFTSLSQNMYEVMKSIKPGYTVYLDHCPMFNDGKGANWISKESSIKNPYYGSQMLTCGKIIETIK